MVCSNLNLKRNILLFLCAIAVIWVFVPSARAQESRGSIQGRILDSSGAVIPGATVAATNIGTNVTIRSTTNQEGVYNLLYLIPSSYSVSVSASGFKKSRRDNIQLPIHERLQLDFTLELGDMTEQVQVTAEAPVLQTANANLGIVVEQRRILELPSAFGSPFTFMYLSAGVIYGAAGAANTAPSYAESDTGFVTVNGSPRGMTEYTIDGISNTQTAHANNGTNAAMSPPADVVEEFKMETAFDASVGRTTGAVMNVSLKAGTNTPHGAAYISLWEPAWNANTFFANRNNIPKGNFDFKRWGASLSGPVFIPKVFNGQNRTFFTYGYEGLHLASTETKTSTVPDLQNRAGDFSNLLAISSTYQIYDPATTQATSDGRYSRVPFANNIVPPSRISPIAKSILSLYPAPNTTGLAGGVNNFVKTIAPLDKYCHHTARVDHMISDKQRLYGRVSIHRRTYGPYSNPFGDSPARGTTYWGRGPQAAFDDVYTLSPSMVLNMRYGYSRFSAGHDPQGLGFDVSDLGFPAQIVSLLAGVQKVLPYFNTAGLMFLGGDMWDYGHNDVHSFFASIIKQQKRHNLHFGADLRAYRENNKNYGYSGGDFRFATTYTNGPYNTSAASPSGLGQGLAALLLGQPTSGSMTRNADSAAQSTYWAFYLHDNWRVSQKLTLDLGLRWEYEGPTTDRFNRAVGGFDALAVQAIEAQAKTAYAAAPDAALSPDNFRVRGGLLFAGVGGRSREFWDPSYRGFAPRVGLAYQALSRLVFRGGFGIYPIQRGVPSLGLPIQTGFSQDTSLVASLDGGQTFLATLANPFPSGLQAATGASLGTATYLGRSISLFDTRAKTPYMMHWGLNMQTMLPAQMLLEVGYQGSRTVRLYQSKNLNALPNSYLSTSPVRDQATIDYLSKSIANPLAGLLPGTDLNGKTIARSSLLVPFPQFSGITFGNPQGYSWYHALQVRLERRFSHGFTTQVAYNYSKLMEAVTYLNAGDALPYRSIGVDDRPQKLTGSGILELPFGRGRRLFGNAGRLSNAMIGGWQVAVIQTFISGAVVDFGNVLCLSNNIVLPSDQRSIDGWFNVNAFERSSAKQPANNLRTFPLRFSSLRTAPVNKWDLSLMKKTKVQERYEFQFRVELMNAFNHAMFGVPNVSPTSSAFGTVTSTLGTARNIMLSMKFTF